MMRVAVIVALLVLATLIVVRGSGPAGVVLWELVVAAALIAVAGRRWPRGQARVASLVGTGEPVRSRPPGPLAASELEVLAAVDESLGPDLRLRRRLASLVEHRAGLASGALTESAGRSLLGDVGWSALRGAAR